MSRVGASWSPGIGRIDLMSGASVEAGALVVVVTTPSVDGPVSMALPAADALLLGAALVDAAMEVAGRMELRAGLGAHSVASWRAFIEGQMKRAAEALEAAAAPPVVAPVNPTVPESVLAEPVTPIRWHRDYDCEFVGMSERAHRARGGG